MIDLIQDWVITQATQNDVFAGLIGASIIGSLFFFVRNIPGVVWAKLSKVFSFSVRVNSYSDLYPMLLDWMNANLSSKVRSVTWDMEGSDRTPLPSIGYGEFLVKVRGSFVLVSRQANDKSTGFRPSEWVELRTFGRSKKLLSDIFEEVLAVGVNDTVQVKAWQDYWSMFSRKAPKPEKSLFLEEGILESLKEDLSTFQAKRDWYREKGVPYKRIYLFSGPPGSGKSSLVTFLAGLLGRDLYTASLGSFHSDSAFLNAMTDLNVDKGILLLEDVDASGGPVKSRRGEGSSGDEVSPRLLGSKSGDAEEQSSLTLSTLLNCLDGPFTPDGLIVFMTTNHPDMLDEALVREGRVDVHQHIGWVSEKVTRDMVKFFFNEDSSIEEEVPFLDKGIYSPARVSQACIKASSLADALERIGGPDAV